MAMVRGCAVVDGCTAQQMGVRVKKRAKRVGCYGRRRYLFFA
jgi:hypothetical protein